MLISDLIHVDRGVSFTDNFLYYFYFIMMIKAVNKYLGVQFTV